MIHTEETRTHKIERTLRESDDFLSVKQLIERSGCNLNQVTASLHTFKKYHVADFVTDYSGTYWYALDPSLDIRTKVVVERIPEKKPRKPRLSNKSNVSHTRITSRP